MSAQTKESPLGGLPPSTTAIAGPLLVTKNSVFPDPMGDKPEKVVALQKIVETIVETKDEATSDTGIIEVDPTKQWWFRKPDSKARKIAEKIAVLDAAGHDDKTIAKKLKTTNGTIHQYRYLARKNGWWDSEDQPIDLEVELALDVERKVVRNISASLDGQMTNWQTHEMTIAAAKGRGIFKNHEKSEGSQAVMQAVAIQVVMPAIGAGDQMPEIADAMWGGVAAFEEGEVIDVESQQLRRSFDGETLPERSAEAGEAG
jgi:transposase